MTLKSKPFLFRHVFRIPDFKNFPLFLTWFVLGFIPLAVLIIWIKNDMERDFITDFLFGKLTINPWYIGIFAYGIGFFTALDVAAWISRKKDDGQNA